MFARLSVYTLTCFSSVLLLFSCEDESKANQSSLIGRWEIVKGFRNQKETETLSGTYFRFNDDGRMQTNLPIGPEEPMEYAVSHNEIRQKSSPPVKYIIQSITDSTLVIGMELRGMQFEMHLRRAPEPPAGPAPAEPYEEPDQQDSF